MACRIAAGDHSPSIVNTTTAVTGRISARAEIAKRAHRYRKHREVWRFGGAKVGEDLAEALVEDCVAGFPGRAKSGGIRRRGVGAQRIGGEGTQRAGEVIAKCGLSQSVPVGVGGKDADARAQPREVELACEREVKARDELE